VGKPLYKLWSLASTNLEAALSQLGPEITAVGTWLLEKVAGIGLGIVQFVIAIVIAGFLLVHSKGGHRVAHGICARLAGDRGSDLADLAEATIRGVTRGVIGVALIQALFAGLGLVVANVPLAGLWTLICLVLCVVHIGAVPIMLPATIYVFCTNSVLAGILFLLWAIFVSTIDNVIGPILMGRGVDVPMPVIFVGAIGGMLVTGLIGLFVGAVILALGYRLFLTWLEMGRTDASPEPAQ
jgi:predicted PurR-regulated permease PerM